MCDRISCPDSTEQGWLTIHQHSFDQLFVLLDQLRALLVSDGSLNVLSYIESYVAYPHKIDSLRNLPAFSSMYFRYYHLSWVVVAVASVWGLIVAVRRKVTLEDVGVFAAFTLLGTVATVAAGLLAIYLSNQTFLA